MRKNPFLVLLSLFLVFGGIFYILLGHSHVGFFSHGDLPGRPHKDSILKLEMDGVILDGKKFLKQLKKYREDDDIKAVVIEANSPGGVVGPSQEIYQEIIRTREEFHKPVVMVSTGLLASGAYYAAVGADKIVVSPGAMMGSIGVIMEFVNLEKLYDWAKVSRYTINTGKYKDSGAEYRSMRPDERALFQELINDVFQQFKNAVAKGRKLAPDFVDRYADGRVFTGAKGVELGFADEVGTIDEAYDIAADLAGIDDYEIYDVPKHRPGFLDLIQGPEDEDMASTFMGRLLGRSESSNWVSQVMGRVFPAELSNRPLYLMPGQW